MTTIVWFRQDLRVHDNPALAAAASRGSVLPLYILDDVTPGHWRMGRRAAGGCFRKGNSAACSAIYLELTHSRSNPVSGVHIAKSGTLSCMRSANHQCISGTVRP